MKQITLIVLTALLLFSCSKNNSTVPDTPDNQQPSANLNDDEKFLVGSWVFERHTDTQTLKDGSKQYFNEAAKPCASDDVYIFRGDKTYIKQQGTDTCWGESLFGEYEWAVFSGGAFTFKHGPSAYGTNTLIRIDQNHFAVKGSYSYYNYSGVLTHYYKRK